jgi:hypothetical protein
LLVCKDEEKTKKNIRTKCDKITLKHRRIPAQPPLPPPPLMMMMI